LLLTISQRSWKPVPSEQANLPDDNIDIHAVYGPYDKAYRLLAQDNWSECYTSLISARKGLL
jgi:hypothetical protein